MPPAKVRGDVERGVVGVKVEFSLELLQIASDGGAPLQVNSYKGGNCKIADAGTKRDVDVGISDGRRRMGSVTRPNTRISANDGRRQIVVETVPLEPARQLVEPVGIILGRSLRPSKAIGRSSGEFTTALPPGMGQKASKPCKARPCSSLAWCYPQKYDL